MNERFKRLADSLLEQNAYLSVGQALSWVEGMWEDFEASSAKAGREYHGPAITEKLISDWIQIYGPNLHEFVNANPKFEHLLRDDHVKH